MTSLEDRPCGMIKSIKIALGGLISKGRNPKTSAKPKALEGLFI